MTTQASLDIFVIGGGINGCGIARDAAGRGASVVLFEKDDLAGATSSRSTKLIHGGLRYLEHYEFRLVREALMERERLWAIAPHIIWPLRFVLPYHKGLRPAWLLRLGLFLYDHLGGRKLLPATKTLDLRTAPEGKPLKPGYGTAFEYSDGWVDDARLVALNARDAADRGATILVRTKVVSARRVDGAWAIETENQRTGARETYHARMLVNAGGPWVDRVIVDALGRNDAHHVRLVKGSHIVVKRLYDHDKCYFFQNADGRIFFAIPYEQEFTLIGTTDQDYEGDPAKVAIDDGEIEYLCAAASEYFSRPVTREDIVWTYSGVRPLFDDGASAAQEATRDYVLKTDEDGGAPVLNVFGGKLTTHRRLSEHALEKIEALIGAKGSKWTAKGRLPGGDFPATGYEDLVRGLVADYARLGPVLLRRLARSYGTLARTMLGERRDVPALGRFFGGTLYQFEVDYLIDREWAMTAEDILWRRTKQGLRFSVDENNALAAYMAERTGG
jgi:glycerol-3-phosphate dehydrogenase